ncbi:MAG: UTP--glucose-1-phosphate uridylyltransferase [Bryobacteraceae bacterium]|nr:UTP--glucose-1-phosphate uridylyltransferase [Bryobacteraceae bacterium]
MKIRKAVVTAAGRRQRGIPLQRVIDRDGTEKSVLRALLDELLTGPLEELALVVAPGDEAAYLELAGEHRSRVRILVQQEPGGYGPAIACARDFTAGEPFFHCVSDHLFVSTLAPGGLTRQLVELAEAQGCAVSAVQATPERMLTDFGAVGGQRLPGQDSLYRVQEVLEKPTPTEAEQRLAVPGLRAGHYLCFFGMHVLTPAVMEWLAAGEVAHLSEALARLARRETYLAAELPARRYDLGLPYGLLTGQLALALAGRDREDVLARLVELLAVSRA